MNAKKSNLDEDHQSYWQSLFIQCEREEDFARAMTILNRELPFRYWSAALCRMQGDWQVTSQYRYLGNLPTAFMQDYRANATEYFDAIVAWIFHPEHFGQLSHWSAIYQWMEQQKAQNPEQVQMHHNWLKQQQTWGIGEDGYSLGERILVESEQQWYGTIINYIGGMELSAETEATLLALRPFQHLAILRVMQSKL